MNRLMEKINDKFKDTAERIVFNTMCNFGGIIIFVLALVLFIDNAVNNTNIVFKVMCIVATILCAFIIKEIIKDTTKTIRARIRDCRNYVDVAMHKINEKQCTCKDKGNHIPSIEF